MHRISRNGLSAWRLHIPSFSSLPNFPPLSTKRILTERAELQIHSFLQSKQHASRSLNLTHVQVDPLTCVNHTLLPFFSHGISGRPVAAADYQHHRESTCRLDVRLVQGDLYGCEKSFVGCVLLFEAYTATELWIWCQHRLFQDHTGHPVCILHIHSATQSQSTTPDHSHSRGASCLKAELLNKSDW